MKLYEVALFGHVFTVVLTALCAGGLHVCAILIRISSSMNQVRLLWKPFKFGPLFGALDLTILLFGMWLIRLSDDPNKYEFSTPFVAAGLAVIGYLFVGGLVVLDPFIRRVDKALAATTGDEVPDSLRKVIFDPTVMVLLHVGSALFLALIFDMTTKPGAVVAVIALAVGVVVGVLAGMAMAGPVRSSRGVSV